VVGAACPFTEPLLELRKLTRALHALDKHVVAAGQALAKLERIWPTDAPNLQRNGEQPAGQIVDSVE
jgi:hypothetical protein